MAGSFDINDNPAGTSTSYSATTGVQTSFKVQCQKFAEKIDVNLSTVVRRVSAGIYSDIVKAWPVDTGYSRRNWQVSANTPLEGTIGEQPKKGQSAVLEPLYAPDGANTALPLAKGDLDVWIVNNVVYAEALENGHSKQAPNGCVRIAVATAEAEMETTVATEDSSANSL